MKFLQGVEYLKINDAGLHVNIQGKPDLLEVDNVIICAGQDPLRELQAPLTEKGVKVHLIGGADVASELDAKRAINQAVRLAATI